MTIPEMIDSVIKGQVEEQKMRYDSIKSKNENIEKHKKYIEQWVKEKRAKRRKRNRGK